MKIMWSSAYAGILLAILIAGCGKNPNDSAQSGNRVVPIEASVAQEQELALQKTYSGSLEGEEQANIVAKISERVTDVHVHVGQVVRVGQVLLSMDKAGAQSHYYQAEANYKNSEKTLQRMQSLYGEGAVSQQTLDGAQTAFDVAKADYQAASSLVDLVTPIAGVVTAVNATVGDMPQPGSILVTVARIETMKLTFSLNEADVTHLAVGDPVTVYSEAKPDVKRTGKISQLSKSADVGSRSFEVKALFGNTKDYWFKPGMFCKANVSFAGKGKVLVVPSMAIQSDGISSKVFVVLAGHAYARAVRPGVSDGTSTEILQGLSAGDSVATLGISSLRDSIAVAVAAH